MIEMNRKRIRAIANQKNSAENTSDELHSSKTEWIPTGIKLVREGEKEFKKKRRRSRRAGKRKRTKRSQNKGRLYAILHSPLGKNQECLHGQETSRGERARQRRARGEPG